MAEPERSLRRLFGSGIEGLHEALDRATGLKSLRVRGTPAVFMALYLKVIGWNIKTAATILFRVRLGLGEGYRWWPPSAYDIAKGNAYRQKLGGKVEAEIASYDTFRRIQSTRAAGLPEEAMRRFARFRVRTEIRGHSAGALSRRLGLHLRMAHAAFQGSEPGADGLSSLFDGFGDSSGSGDSGWSGGGCGGGD